MFDPSTMTGAGLFTTGETRVAVPLEGISIDADIRNFYARSVVSQRYVNREATPIEAVYVFPLDEGAAVCGFEAIVDGTLVVGEVFEREKAFDMYDDAMEQGHGAFLRSGSMQGTSIEDVRNALQLCLRSMTQGCRFNIVGFGSNYEALFPESRSYDQASMEAANQHVGSMQADLGGTELLPALQFALGRPRSLELPRQIVILTDGEVTNTDAVIELAGKHAADARIFTFGIGAGSSHHLVRGVARAGGGSAEFIYPGERLEPKVLRQFARLLSPALADVGVEWTGGVVTQSPMNVPPVFAGGRLLVYGLVKHGRPTNARLSATSPSGPVSFDVPLGEAATSSDRIVTTLAARARIRELEEGSEWLAARGSQQKDRKAAGARNEIIALSVKYGLISRETSFVAIERRDTPVIGDVKLRKVPVALTTGWGGLQQVSARGSHLYRMTLGGADIHDGTVRLGAAHSKAPEFEGWMSAPEAVASAELRLPAEPRWLTRRRRASKAPHSLQELIVLQSADGSWELTRDLGRIVERDFDQLTDAIRGATGRADDVGRAWATALAVAWLGCAPRTPAMSGRC